MDEHREEREELDAIQREDELDAYEARMDAFMADARRYEQVNDS